MNSVDKFVASAEGAAEKFAATIKGTRCATCGALEAAHDHDHDCRAHADSGVPAICTVCHGQENGGSWTVENLTRRRVSWGSFTRIGKPRSTPTIEEPTDAGR